MPSTPPRPTLPRRPRPAPFKPRGTLMLMYLAGFFMLFALLLVLPEMLDVLAETPPGPEQEAAAKEAVHAVAGPRILMAFGLAVVTAGLGAYYRVLPGLRT